MGKSGSSAHHLAPIKEGNITLTVGVGTISKALPVFYNPVMRRNRDLSTVLLQTVDSDFVVCDPLAGSGIRSLRFLDEVPGVQKILVNDHREGFKEQITAACAANNLPCEKLVIGNEDATLFMARQPGFDYVDIDPFGSPNSFLDMSIKRLSRQGILAVTATDTGALCGTYPRACQRKYWAQPLHTHLMHEVGLRILLRKVQMIGMQYEKALEPLLSYHCHHYMRAFFRCRKQKSACDDLLKQHRHLADAGPLWTGPLGDLALSKRMLTRGTWLEKHDYAFLQTLAEEYAIDVPGFYDLHEIAERHKLATLPKMETIIDAVRAQGHPCVRTHFSAQGLRTTMPQKDFEEILKRK